MAVILLTLGGTNTAKAAISTLTWNGGGDGTTWATGNGGGNAFRNNWGGTAFTLGDNAIFAGTSFLSPTIGSGAMTAGFVQFASGAGAFTIGGTAVLTIGTGVTNLSTTLQSFTVPITLGAAQTWSAESGNLSFSGNVTNGGFLLSVAGANNTTISGVVAGTGGLTKNGTGTLTLSGGAANTFSGLTTVNAGTLTLSKSSGNAIAGNLTIGDSTGTDTVRLTAANQIADTSAVTINSSGVLDLNGNSDTVGTLTMTAGSVTTGAGTLTLGGDVTGNADAASATISGNVALGANRTFTIADGGAAIDMNISAIISGAGLNLTKAGAGTLGLSGANTYTGTTTVNDGTLLVGADAPSGSAGALGNASSAVLVGNPSGSLNASLLVGGTFTVGRNITVQSGGSGTATLGGNTAAVSTFGGNITLNKGAILTAASGGEAVFSGAISGAGGITKSGAGTVTLNAANNYSGGTTLNQGTLKLGVNDALGTGGFTFVGGILDANNTTDSTIGALTMSGTSTLLLHADASAGSLTFTSAAWTTGTLTITGWSGIAGSAGSDDTLFVTGSASQDFLDNIFFTTFGAGAIQLGSGEIVPVPEPINVALGVFGAVFVVFGIGRRYVRARRQA